MFYKYRSLENNGFYQCMDILVNKRMFASRYLDFNDPMEGFYLDPEGRLSDEIHYKLQEEMKAIRILSLSKRKDSTLMWSHYADSHKGIVIGIETYENIDTLPVLYEDHIALTEGDISYDTCKQLLCRKLSPWSYEEEVRIFTYKNYVPIKIKEIIYGTKIKQTVRSVLRRIIKAVDPSIQFINVKDLK